MTRALALVLFIVVPTYAIGRCGCTCCPTTSVTSQCVYRSPIPAESSSNCTNQLCEDKISGCSSGGPNRLASGDFAIFDGTWEVITDLNVACEEDDCCMDGEVTITDTKIGDTGGTSSWAYNGRSGVLCQHKEALSLYPGIGGPIVGLENTILPGINSMGATVWDYNENDGRAEVTYVRNSLKKYQYLYCKSGGCTGNVNWQKGKPTEGRSSDSTKIGTGWLFLFAFISSISLV